MFDCELFLELCKKYNVPFSSKYKVPMIQEEDGMIRELTPEYLKQVLLKKDDENGSISTEIWNSVNQDM